MKAMNVSAKAMLFLLYCVGLMSLFLLFAYLVCGVWYVFSDADYPGAIAFIPKWIFLLGIFAFLGKARSVKQTLNGIVDYLDEKIG